MWGATPVTASVAEHGDRPARASAGCPPTATSEVPVIAANPVGRPGRAGASTRPGCRSADVALRVVDLDTGAVLRAG